MSSRTIAIPRLLHVAPDCISDLAPLLARHAFDCERVCVGSGPGASAPFAEAVVEGLRRAGLSVVHVPGLEGRLEQSAQGAALIIEEHVTLAVAVGGGRVIDTMKLAAARTGTDFVSIPTTIAHDGISSPVSSLTGRDGARDSFAAAMPAGIVVDLQVIGSSPPRTLRAGVGDLASNLTAVLDWRLADREGLDRYDAFSAMIADSAARPVLELRELEQADSQEVLAHGLLLSGLAMAAAGTSRPCSGAEHLISHSLDRLLGAGAGLHGEQVALGTLISAAAHESPLLGALRGFFAGIGLPTRPADLGISDARMLEAVMRAPATRPERYTILSGLTDDEGRVRALLDQAFLPQGEPRVVSA